jgi:aspartate carbamoyltransferase regulatory subunit
MVLNELTEQIGDNDYYLCMNEECDITYYNTKFNVKFNYKRQYFFVQKCKYFHVQLIIFLADLG